MTTRKLALAIALAALIALAVPAVASANFAIHGSYVEDTDACAGCHRAHTSISSIQWSDVGNNEHSALLVSSATAMWQFCYACHDATSQGADTNVQWGIYEGSDYGTPGGILNGGGFESVLLTATTSTHMMKGTSWGAYGGGYAGQGQTNASGQIPGADVGESVPIKMDCTSCHDPHGSSNYRILKAYVNGNYVGGYQANAGDPENPIPDGYVSSVETGWPVNGFELHEPTGAYEPNYTTAMYAKGYDMATADGSDAAGLNDAKGMSGWCAGCHATYLRDRETFTKSDGTTYSASASMYNAGDGGGYARRHRHPINVELDSYNAGDKASMIVTDQILPLANGLSEIGNPGNDKEDWIECLTCHRAHGTAAQMGGYAEDTSRDSAGNIIPAGHSGDASVVDTDGVSRNNYVASASALLRRDNRGVCEACHNK